MFKLLNRFAWLIAILIGIQISGLFGLYFLGNIGHIIVGIILGFFIKKFFLSESFISDRLEFFANSIKNNYLGNNENIIEKQEILEKNNISENKNILQETTIEKETIDLSEIEEVNQIKQESEKLEIEEELERQKIVDMQNSEKYIKDKETAFDIFIGKIGSYIKDFFSTNLLAKLGGILVFLAVVYFLKGFVGDLWEVIGPKGRIATGILIGFATYFVGVKLHPKYQNEGLILMGIGILINFEVILSGRYLVGDGGFILEGTTFIFLILNTIFAVLTSLIYKSKILLLFSFIFAYLNPILTGGSSDTPYTLIGYSLIVSLGALYLSIREASLTLLVISFIAGNILFWQAPFSDSIGWSAKIILTSILSIISIISARKFKGLKPSVDKLILNLFIGTYIFIILNLLNTTTSHSGMLQVMGNALDSKIGFIVYNLIILGLFAFTIRLIKSAGQQGGFSPLNFFLFLPLIILTGILFSGNLIFTPFILIGTIILYLIAFSFLNLSNIFSYIFFGILAVFIFLFNLESTIFGHNLELNNTEFIVTIITSLIFLFSAYYYSTKEKLSALFPIGTIGTILILSPIIINNTFKKIYIYENGESILTQVDTNFLFNLSIIGIIIFAVINWVLPFISKNLFKKENLNNLIIGSLAGALFFAFQIYNFGEIHFPGVVEGFVFLALAIIYFIQAYFITQKIGVKNMKSDPDLKNIFYSFSGISISLFSVAIAFVFSEHPEIITTTWLFEATILYFFYSKTKNIKIFWAATLLFIIGLTKFGILLDVVQAKEYLFLISFAVILASFILNLYFINKVEIKNRLSTEGFSPLGFHNFHHILHIIGMAIMGGLLLKIIPSTGHGWSMLGISLFTLVLGSFYSKFNFKFLKITFLILISGVSILHIGDITNIFWKLEYDKIEYLKVLQYFVSIIIISNLFIWNKSNKSKSLNKILLIIISIYGFIISNIFVIDLFDKIFGDFTLTIYWGLIASALLIYGIQKNIIKYRTIGLYFLSLTSAKIFLYDVWQIGDTNSRVAVFAILGVIFITISTLYTKRFGDNLLGEFSLNNLKDSPHSVSPKGREEAAVLGDKEEEKEDKIVNIEIENIDISNIKSVRFTFKNGKSISIRAVNLIKISKFVINQLDGQTKFEPEELKEIFDFIKNNYKSELSKDNFEKITNILKKFVKEGGEVEMIKI